MVATIPDLTWPLTAEERLRLAWLHEQKNPPASETPDGYRLATCVVCERPMVAMWHLWVRASYERPYPGRTPEIQYVNFIKEIHMCHACATDIYGAPTPDGFPSPTPGCIACATPDKGWMAIGHTCGP